VVAFRYTYIRICSSPCLHETLYFHGEFNRQEIYRVSHKRSFMFALSRRTVFCAGNFCLHPLFRSHSFMSFLAPPPDGDTTCVRSSTEEYCFTATLSPAWTSPTSVHSQITTSLIRSHSVGRSVDEYACRKLVWRSEDDDHWMI
jgi:hypothetical protein